ncbi:hypothetical protein B0H19DRAFT_155681 [Mycena capillaripes]|nr:hypothetical protein B0H19DRAFT_155681 [Mycena capillaripes]
MASSAVAQLEVLLAQLRGLDLQNAPPELEQQLGAAAEAAKAHIDRHKNALPPAPDPTETRPAALTPEILQPVLSMAPNSLKRGQQAEIGALSQNLTAPSQSVPHSTSNPANLRLPTPTSKSAPYMPGELPPSSSESATPQGRFSWVNVDFGDSRPSESAYTNPAEQRQFGMPLTGAIPLEPPLELFVWPKESLSTAGKPKADRLVSAPSAPQPPKGCGVYPEAPEYVLNVELDVLLRPSVPIVCRP